MEFLVRKKDRIFRQIVYSGGEIIGEMMRSSPQDKKKEKTSLRFQQVRVTWFCCIEFANFAKFSILVSEYYYFLRRSLLFNILTFKIEKCH